MWVHRWAILRSPLPHNLSLKKIIALVHALARLHNFCIDEQPCAADFTDFPQPRGGDILALMAVPNGFIDLEEVTRDDGRVDAIPQQLLGGGEHFVDVPRMARRRGNVNDLPRTLLHDKVAESHHCRPRLL